MENESISACITGETKSCSTKSSPKTKIPNNKPGAIKLRKWLNKSLQIQMSDGRVLVGIFLCTDRDANVILGSCAEYLPGERIDVVNQEEEPRMLGLVMVPGRHIVSISIDQNGYDSDE